MHRVIYLTLTLELPERTAITGITAHGASFWTRTACLDGDTGGETKKFFLKVSFGDRGRKMMSGEFKAMSLMYAAKPDLVPKVCKFCHFEACTDSVIHTSLSSGVVMNGCPTHTSISVISKTLPTSCRTYRPSPPCLLNYIVPEHPMRAVLGLGILPITETCL